MPRSICDKLKHNGLRFASGIEIIFDWHRRSMVLPRMGIEAAK
jgi:alpha-D-ribose 1-methylphosphonate 5-triphosphate synthase subunit PhnH